MRKTVHLCLASHDEVLFRSDEDLIRGFNSFAVACRLTETRALADGLMSDHVHFVVATDDTDELTRQLRYDYTRYFNRKYGRDGRLGDKKFYITEIVGTRHLLAAISYVNRQALHHGLCSTPFGYRHCSANVIFAEELGKAPAADLLSLRSYYNYIPRDKIDLMKGCRMSSDGQLLREDVIDVKYVQELYMTARNFLFYMNRITNDDWKREQGTDTDAGPMVSIDTIEQHVTPDEIREMLVNENGRVDRKWMTDMELCALIDKVYLPRLYPGRESIYQLSDRERTNLGNRLLVDCKRQTYLVKVLNKYFTREQLCRCLVIR
ncbi:MAG: hypothetical protein KBT05_08400 [Bacteroidales bacterium]|nr:hypothetical protein [Candidatus Cryptobacteroides caccocaballi]